MLHLHNYESIMMLFVQLAYICTHIYSCDRLNLRENHRSTPLYFQQVHIQLISYTYQATLPAKMRTFIILLLGLAAVAVAAPAAEPQPDCEDCGRVRT